MTRHLERSSSNPFRPNFSQKGRVIHVWYLFEASGLAVSAKMEKNEFCAVKHFYLKKWTAAQTKAELNEVHGNSAFTLKVIYFWINEFKRGRTCTEDEARSG